MSQTEYSIGDSIFTPTRRRQPSPVQGGPTVQEGPAPPVVFELDGRMFSRTRREGTETEAPIEPVDERSFLQKGVELFTGGEERQAVRDVPEIVTPLMYPSLDTETDPFAGASQAEQSKALAGILAKIDPQARIDVLKANIPGLEVIDENTVTVGGQQFIVNKKGFSHIDAQTLAAQIGAFAGPAKILNMIKTGWRATAAVPLFGGTSAALDTLAGKLGSEQGISAVNAALVGITGGVATWATPHIARWFSRKGILDSSGKVTDAGRKILKKLGAEADDMTQEALEKFNVIFKNASGNMRGAGGPAAVTQAEAEAVGVGVAAEDEAILAAASRIRQQIVGHPDVLPPITAEAAGSDVANVIANRVSDIKAAMAGKATTTASPLVNATLTKSSFEEYAKSMLGALRSAATPQGWKKGDLTNNSVKDLLSLVRPKRPPVATGRGAKRPVTSKVSDDTALDHLFGSAEARAFPTPFATGGGTTTETILGPHSAEVLRMGQTPTSITLKRIETYRTKLADNIKKATDPLDVSNLISMKTTLDDWLGGALDNALAAGDDVSLAMMKKYPGLWKDIKKNFSAGTDGDVVGAVMNKLINIGEKGQGPTNTAEAMNMIFGAETTFAGKGAPVLEQLGNILGKESKEWASLQSSALYRVMYGTAERAFDRGQSITGNMIKSQIDDFLTGSGKEISELLFTKTQSNQLGQLSRVIERGMPKGTPTQKIGFMNQLLRGTEYAAGLGLTAIAAKQAMTGGWEHALPSMLGAGGLGIFSARRIGRPVTQVASDMLNLPKPMPLPLVSSTIAAVEEQQIEPLKQAMAGFAGL